MQFRPILTENLNSVKIIAGQLIIDIKDNAIYVDKTNKLRIKIAAAAEKESILQEINALFDNYYTKQEIDEKFAQLNKEE